MADYIERNQALDRFTYENGDMIPETLETGAENTVSIKTVKAVLRSLPAADVAPVVHGHWIDKTNISRAAVEQRVDCSVCGHIFYTTSALSFEYCPHCGAKMDGDSKEVKK